VSDCCQTIWNCTDSAREAAIKAGITTITIVVVALALLPLKSLIDDLKVRGKCSYSLSTPIDHAICRGKSFSGCFVIPKLECL
jgi:hypothetical protein